MGDMTRTQMVTEIANTMGRELGAVQVDGTLTLEERIRDYWIEWAQVRMARAYSFPELDVIDTTSGDTVASTKTYTYDTLFGSTYGPRVNRILSLVLEDGLNSVKLSPKLYSSMDMYRPYPEGDSEEKPRWYTDFGRSIEFVPIPDAAYDIHSRLSLYPTEFSGDSSVSDFIKKDDIIIAAAVVEGFLAMKMRTLATTWEKIYMLKMQEAVIPVADHADWAPEGRAFRSNLFDSYGALHQNPLVLDNP